MGKGDSYGADEVLRGLAGSAGLEVLDLDDAGDVIVAFEGEPDQVPSSPWRPRLETEDMWAHCATPANFHGYPSPPFRPPVPAWPASAAHLMRFREMFNEMVQRNEARKRTAATHARAAGHHRVTVTDSRSRSAPERA